jgi:hypothetical protein
MRFGSRASTTSAGRSCNAAGFRSPNSGRASRRLYSNSRRTCGREPSWIDPLSLCASPASNLCCRHKEAHDCQGSMYCVLSSYVLSCFRRPRIGSLSEKTGHVAPHRFSHWTFCVWHAWCFMHPFASYVLRTYYSATGWNEDNLYSNLTRSSNGSLRRSLERFPTLTVPLQRCWTSPSRVGCTSRCRSRRTRCSGRHTL